MAEKVNPLRQLIEKINKLNPRERMLIALVAVVLLLAIWDALLFSDQNDKWKANSTEITLLKQKLATSEALENQLKIQVKQDPNEREKIKLQRLQSEVARLDKDLKERTIEFISPQQMVPALKEIIDQQTQLKLISLKTLGAVPLLDVQEQESKSKGNLNDDDKKPTASVYKHSLEMVLKGDYFSVLLYMKKIENLGWRFNWDLVSLTMDKYPMSNIKIRINTLSMEEGWIGV